MKKTRRLYKKFLRNYLFPVIGNILYWYLKFVYKTSHIKIDVMPEAEKYYFDLEPAIYAFWHGRLLMMATIHKPEYQMRVLASKNEIGIMAEHCLSPFGIKLIRGSSRNPKKPDVDKGGSKALIDLVDALNNGYPIGITPDGPLGPAMKVAHGIVVASIRSQKPVIPMTYSCTAGYNFKSWDRFLFPFPFGTIHFLINTPLFPPKDMTPKDFELFRQKIEKQLQEDLHDLDKICKRIK